MKKSILFLLVLVFVFAMAACGTKNKENGQEDTSGSGTEVKEEQNENNAQTEQKEGDAEMAETKNYPQLSTEVTGNEKLVQMNTNLGSVKIKLFPDQAPKTVENFLTHAKDGYYDGIIFHRVINGFMIQGGDPTGTGRGGESIFGESFEDEFSPELFNLRGALSMANAGPNTNGSQFFIVQAKDAPAPKEEFIRAGYPEEIADAYTANGGTPHLDGKHTVFGQVVEGMDIVDKIAGVAVAPGDKPKEDVVINSIDIIKE